MEIKKQKLCRDAKDACNQEAQASGFAHAYQNSSISIP